VLAAPGNLAAGLNPDVFCVGLGRRLAPGLTDTYGLGGVGAYAAAPAVCRHYRDGL
jgi:hypothetical protein